MTTNPTNQCPSCGAYTYVRTTVRVDRKNLKEVFVCSSCGHGDKDAPSQRPAKKKRPPNAAARARARRGRES